MIDYTYHNHEDHIHVLISGNLEVKETAAMGYKMREMALKERKKLILDFRNSSLTFHLSAVINWIEDYYDNFNKNLRYVPTALIYNPTKDTKEIFEYAKILWTRKGLIVNSVQSKEDALEWLKKAEYPKTLKV